MFARWAGRYRMRDVALRRRGAVWESMLNAGRKRRTDEIRHPDQGWRHRRAALGSSDNRAGRYRRRS